MLSPKVIRAPGAPPPPPPPKPEKPPGRITQDDDGGGGGVTNNNSVAPNGHGATVPSRIPDEEQVVMTPLGKTNTSTVLLVERKLIEAVGERTHVAGGDHRGIIINKTTEEPSSRQRDPAQLSLEFRVFLVSANTGQHSQESRRIKFWFRPWLTSDDVQAQVAQDFFRELVSPKEFPRDYVGFIKKIMKLLQKGYNEIQAVEIELRILEQTSAPPSRPSRPGHVIICYGNCHKRAPNSNDGGDHKTHPGGGGGGGDGIHNGQVGVGGGSIHVTPIKQQHTERDEDGEVSFEDEQFEVVPLTPEKILELIEQAYPNPITPDDLAKDHGWEEEEVMAIMLVLKERGLIKSMEYNSYTRIHHDDQAIKIVKQMPTIASNKQPTIAIITAQYCEKLAVDAMLENKETFVRYTTVGTSPDKPLGTDSTERTRRRKNRFGESNVYTLGNIGAHRIVSTKLPSVGSTREAMTAAGNTTTRLLGTFQKVDHVFIVGVAGGIPHYTDYRRHVRLGDVVIAAAAVAPVPDATTQKPYCYVYSGPGEVKRYYPLDDGLQAIARTLAHNDDGKRPWVRYVQEGLQQLGGGHGESNHQHDFARPAPNTDKLYMNIGNRNVIEVAHPVATPSPDDPDGNDGTDGVPTTRLHAGPIGSGHELVRSDSARTEYAQAYNLLATDVEMNSVLDSIVGNCRDSFILVKGIADYKDGTTSRKWQNYASLAAAAVMKTIVCAMDAPTNV
ncbi:uncharacterized protein LOC131291370 [Anopheles ziemanni]|uniref:uncharacterized protein LOC131291370 n=1 Tax=Anopheles ziemanni TaxID=345580 RepID=UPI0026584FD4|nr:uncharacterized protein LOC131269731 isoform X1 [Anopheles coustani]XP_058176552.1 uncharacterized protein LOC131291370 [Anopheles ziemanni]